MKKILYTFLALIFVIPTIVGAATFSFVPSTSTLSVGETFNISVYVNPSSGESITTAKLFAIFEAETLEVVSFSIESGWIPLTQPGYDLTDNTSGKLIRTGGYPAKVQSQKKFGVLTLKAKSAGTATINIDSNSLLLDTTNTNKYVSSAGATFTIMAPTPTPEVVEPTPTPGVPVAPKTTVTTAPTVVDDTSSDEDTVVEEEGNTEDTSADDQTAAAGSSRTSTRTYVYYGLGALVIALAVVLFVNKRKIGGGKV